MKPIHRIPPARRDEIKKQKDYKRYKDDLKTDFHNSCGYCGDSCEYYEPHIDHFRPQNPKIDDPEELKKFQANKTTYSNLVLACPYCNRRKSNKWPTENFDLSHDGQKGFVDPCDVTFNEHLSRRRDGRIYYKSQIGQYMLESMGLGIMRHQIIWLINELAELHSRACEKKSCAELADIFKELATASQNLTSIIRDDA